jgi:hypothetical protein
MPWLGGCSLALMTALWLLLACHAQAESEAERSAVLRRHLIVRIADAAPFTIRPTLDPYYYSATKHYKTPLF